MPEVTGVVRRAEREAVPVEVAGSLTTAHRIHRRVRRADHALQRLGSEREIARGLARVVGIQRLIKLVVDGRLFHEGKRHEDPRPSPVVGELELPCAGRRIAVAADCLVLVVGKDLLLGRSVVLKSQTDLLEFVGTAAAPGGLAGGLNRREEEADERADDRDHNEQLNERERPAGTPPEEGLHGHQ